MPAVGDQHKSSWTANPFEEEQPRISEFTAVEIATLQSRLDKQLGPEYISCRAGPGGSKVHYLTAEKVINLANGVFGFNGWSSSIKAITIDFADEHPQTGKVTLGLSVIVRVTLKDGTYHEDIGYGHIENCKGKAAAYEKAKKEGTTDGMKRALRSFGNVLGNCLYDKDFVGKVTKIKVTAPKWDADILHRHPDFAPPKVEAPQGAVTSKEMVSHAAVTSKEVVEHVDAAYDSGDDEFGSGIDLTEFDLAEASIANVDEVTIPAEPRALSAPQKPADAARPPVQTRPILSANNGTTHAPKQAPAPNSGQPLNNHANQPHLQKPYQQQTSVQSGQTFKPNAPALAPTNQQNYNNTHSPSPNKPLPGARNQLQPNTNNLPQQPLPRSARTLPPAQNLSRPTSNNAPQQPLPAPAAGFYSARALKDPSDASVNTPVQPLPNAPQFNPHSESPSIRKTAGVDHSRSVPVKRNLTTVPTNQQSPGPNSNLNPAPTRDFVNPSNDMNRRIGAPPQGFVAPRGGMHSSAYRPPSRLGPGENLPLPGTTNVHHGGQASTSGTGTGDAGVRRGPTDNTPPSSALNNHNGNQASNGSTAQVVAGIKRPPLTDVSNRNSMGGSGWDVPASHHQGGPGAGNRSLEDAKRQRLNSPVPPPDSKSRPGSSHGPGVENVNPQQNVPLPGSR